MPQPIPIPIRKPVRVNLQVHLRLPNGMISRNIFLIASNANPKP